MTVLLLAAPVKICNALPVPLQYRLSVNGVPAGDGDISAGDFAELPSSQGAGSELSVRVEGYAWSAPVPLASLELGAPRDLPVHHPTGSAGDTLLHVLREGCAPGTQQFMHELLASPRTSAHHTVFVVYAPVWLVDDTGLGGAGLVVGRGQGQGGVVQVGAAGHQSVVDEVWENARFYGIGFGWRQCVGEAGTRALWSRATPRSPPPHPPPPPQPVHDRAHRVRAAKRGWGRQPPP